jgi:protein-S-isoprenylcysteine O-methyltransferase Ste14
MDISRFQRFFGVGPMGALISLVLLAIAVRSDRVLGHPAMLVNPAPVRVVGVILIVTGLGLQFWSMVTLRNWWAKDKLCMMGPFKWFRHPLYAAWISFVLPGIALYLNSWIVLFFVILLHPVWHRLVAREEKLMLEKFHDVYRAYAAQTGRFFPRIGRHPGSSPPICS